jgi:hypothetical protein
MLPRPSLKKETAISTRKILLFPSKLVYKRERDLVMNGAAFMTTVQLVCESMPENIVLLAVPPPPEMICY